MRGVQVKVPASAANLGPGFDSLGMALKLYNRVVVQVLDREDLEIEIEGEGEEVISLDKDNIVYRAMVRGFDEAGVPIPGLSIFLENNIPISRGLGSSAAARIAGLTAARHLSKGKYSDSRVIDIASELEGHPDNAVASLVGGFVVSSKGDGGVEYIRLEPPQDLKFVVAVPNFELATEKARRVLPENVSLENAVHNLSRTALLVASFVSRDYEYLKSATEDLLHQPYRESLIPGMRDVFDAALDDGALGVAICGAGASLFALVKDNWERVGKSMQEVWADADVESKILFLEPDIDGAAVEPLD